MDKVKRRTLRAFTLLELIVVVAIIAILMAIIVPNTQSYMRTSRIEAANDQAQQIFMTTQDYLVTKQLRNEKVEGIFGAAVSDVVYVGATVHAGQAITEADIWATNDSTMTASEVVALNQIVSGLSGDFQGAFLIQIYPATYTVKAAFFCDQPSHSTGDFDSAAVKYVGDPTNPHYFTTPFGSYTVNGIDRAQEGMIMQGTTPEERQYVGQYPMPIND